jgi:phosphate transport system substrate-binding protein
MKFQIPNLKFKILLLASCLLLLAACGPTPTVTREPVTLTIAVAEAGEPLVIELTEAYRVEHPNISFQVIPASPAAAVEAALAGQADLAVVAQVSTTEMVWLTPVALDNIAVIVNPTNPITGLTTLQVRDIFHGRASVWNEVGGRPDDIVVVTRERGADTRGEIESRVLEGRNVTLNAVVASSNEAVVDMVSTITSAVGYVSMGFRPAGVKMVAVEGVWPTPFTATDRTYPLSRPVYFVAMQEPEPGPAGHLRDFVAWVLGPDGQRVVGQRYGWVR